MRQVDGPRGLTLHAHERGDEKAGQKEEDRDAEPAGHAVHARVRDEHDQKADRAQAVERRNVHRRRARPGAVPAEGASDRSGRLT